MWIDYVGPPVLLWQDATWQQRTVAIGATGRRSAAYTTAGTVQVIESQPSPRELERWSQTEHPVTHELQIGTAAAAGIVEGDRLLIGTRVFLVRGIERPPWSGGQTLLGCTEERDR